MATEDAVDVAPAQTVAPAPAKKKRASKPKSKKPANHPKYSDMIKVAITTLKERGGSSRQAILKYIMAHYNVGKDEKVINSHLKMALRAGAKNGTLKQSKGTGASGSFKLGTKEGGKEKKAKSPKKPSQKASKPKSAKVKKPKAKKASSPKKASGAKKPKSPKKPKKPKAAKAATPGAAKPKKPKSPKKKSPKKAKKAQVKK